jgi:hypothetical protein
MISLASAGGALVLAVATTVTTLSGRYRPGDKLLAFLEAL